MPEACRTALATILFWPLYWGWTLVCMMIFPLPWAWLVVRGQAQDRAMRKLIWAYGVVSMRIIGLFARVSVKDSSVGVASQPAVVVCNHASFFDMHCMGSLGLDDLGGVVRAWPFRIPAFGFFMRRAGYLNSEELGAEELLGSARVLIKRGTSMVFFPEGTRSVDGTLGRFYSGAFRLAVEAGVPVVPVCLCGTGRFLRKGGMLIRRSRISIRALEPVFPEDFDGPAAHLDMKKQVKSTMGKCLAGADFRPNHNPEGDPMRTGHCKRLTSLLLILAATVLLATGCRTSPVYNVSGSPTLAAGTAMQLSMEQAENAIVMGGATRGWKIHKVRDGLMEGVLNVRSHMAVVSIPYSAQSYDIIYKDSVNLKYNGAKIHSNYNSWVRNLDRAIQTEMAKQISQ